MNPLTAREKEILTLVSYGHTNPRIAGKLEVSTETVKSHLAAVYAKLGTSDRAHAVAVALRAGYIT